jgi:CDP-diacylglycerol--glycerol-3-phosphate 3-phosphatidyltransferase
MSAVALASGTGSHNHIIKKLQAQWWKAFGLSLAILLGSHLTFAWRNAGLNEVQWILQALTVTMYVLGVLKYGLKWNFRSDHSNLKSTLGCGTWLTITRGALIAVLAGYLFQPWPVSKSSPGGYSWTPGLLYIAAAILDYADGRVARVYRHETRLGAYLDINFDALGLLIAPMVGVWYGQLPVAYLSVGCAYYIYRTGIWLRKKFSKPVREPGPWRCARMIAGAQMGFVGIALLPILRPPVTTLAAYVFMIPLLAGFLKDWMIVCGYLDSK